MSLESKWNKICVNPECQKSFKSKHRDKRFCSTSCKDKVWRTNNLAYYRELYQKGPSYFHSRNKAWRETHRKEASAETLAGINISLKGKSCQQCGTVTNLHRHHPDYSKPLEVVILCVKCHNRLHHGGILN